MKSVLETKPEKRRSPDSCNWALSDAGSCGLGSTCAPRKKAANSSILKAAEPSVAIGEVRGPFHSSMPHSLPRANLSPPPRARPNQSPWALECRWWQRLCIRLVVWLKISRKNCESVSLFATCYNETSQKANLSELLAGPKLIR